MFEIFIGVIDRFNFYLLTPVNMVYRRLNLYPIHNMDHVHISSNCRIFYYTLLSQLV